MVLQRADAGEHDPALRPFLASLENDLMQHPERLVALDSQRASLQALTLGAEFDLDAELGQDEE